MTTEEIAKVAEMAADRALAKYCEKPPCGLPKDAACELSHFMGMVKDIGGDSYAKGIEAIRSNNKIVMRYLRLCERIGNSMVALVVAAIFGIVWLVAGRGCQAWFRDFLYP